MANETDAKPPAQATAADRTARGWATPLGVPGIYGLTPEFDSAVGALQRTLTALDPQGSTGPTWYPPVVPQATIDRAQYALSFPNLLASVHAQPTGSTADANRTPTDLVLAPAVCYSVYPAFADTVLTEQVYADAAGYCYRHEATDEPGRLRSFRMREFVTVGPADAVWQWREGWVDRCEALFTRLGIKPAIQPASDPFFGVTAKFMRQSQMQQHLKFEFVVPLHAEDEGTAIASANCHKDHLGEHFGIGFTDVGTAHSACTAFGLERITLALIHVHGTDLANWPELG